MAGETVITVVGNLTADPELWKEDVADSRRYLEGLGSRVPQEIFDQLKKLDERIHAATK